ncbi:threonyl-tRNA synthetase [Coelomomyces lativittatus]|nr:threonyl-tRNA synthetase [Coelomomyces lativittatus]
MLGEACEGEFGCHLCIGPPLQEGGFYYEMALPQEKAVTPHDFPNLEKRVQRIQQEKQPFERLVMSKDHLLTMFQHNPFKCHLIRSKIKDDEKTTVYRCGPLIDLCRGPHVPHTGYIKAFAVLKNSSSYFLGDPTQPSLQRIYGMSFPDKIQLLEYKHFLAEAAKRDHRKIGKEQHLFFFHEWSPGSCFFLPDGAHLYNTLMTLMKEAYIERGFQEVITPNLFNVQLWETSGHWAKYKDNMFCIDIEKEAFALKPMNCPGHCLMFQHLPRSYQELPLRFADFGVLHRNEYSGALSGLTRVRRFQQDDAHIFCTVDQIESEIQQCLQFLKHIYELFGFTFSLKLSTRPENFIGELSVWNQAEKCLEKALNENKDPWTLNPGDGAFYGPKIDITIQDALRRPHQCATIQLDFQLPERFDLKFRTSEVELGKEYQRPVIIHRAILGSVERMLAILTEQFAGKWPFWLSPKQVMVIPVAATYVPYAMHVHDVLHAVGLRAQVDSSESTMNKKIRNAEVAQWNFIFIVGGEEEQAKSVNVRNRDDMGSKQKGEMMQLSDICERLVKLKASRQLSNQI